MVSAIIMIIPTFLEVSYASIVLLFLVLSSFRSIFAVLAFMSLHFYRLDIRFVLHFYLIKKKKNKLQEVNYNFIRRNEEVNIDNGNFMKISRARAITT